MKLTTCVCGLGFALAFSACSSAPSKEGLPKTIPIAFKGKSGQAIETHYYSNARVLSYSNGQLLRDRLEGVDFTVEQKTLEYKPETNLLRYQLETVAKDGGTELHDLAFPELKEKLEYTVNTNGEVLKVSGLPKDSLFYVPALPTPKSPVAIGDTWTMEHVWISARDGVPLRLQVVAILKDIVWCEKKSVCADIELSGDVGLVAKPTVKGASFSSKLWGRLLFSVDRGDVIWSEMRSNENAGIHTDNLAVRSCMVSEMKLDGTPKIKFECDPNLQEVAKTPSY